MNLYPLKFQPLYHDKIWGGRNLERLFGRLLPPGRNIGESWELADLPEGVSVVANGPLAGKSLTQLTRELGGQLLGCAKPQPDGRFPLLLKLLDANDTLSLQVHPDERAVREIGGSAALKTECWYVLESRGGAIYKGLKPGVTPAQFRNAIETEHVEQLVRRIDAHEGDFYYLPAGTVHALGAGIVVAEVQTPSDTTYRVTDWGRGREIHVERSMQCIHFALDTDIAPGAGGDVLLKTDYFTVSRKTVLQKGVIPLGLQGRCAALMFLRGSGHHAIRSSQADMEVTVRAGDTVLLPAAMGEAILGASGPCSWLEVTLPQA